MVHKNITNEELHYIPKSFVQALKDKYESLIYQEVSYKEAWDQVVMDRARRSDAVLKHKLARLEPF